MGFVVVEREEMAVGVGVLEVVVIDEVGMVELVIIGAAVEFGL